MFLLIPSLFSRGAIRRMVSVGSAGILNAQTPFAPRVMKWRKGEAANLRRRQLGKCGGEIFPCEFAVAGQDRPEQGANHLSKPEADRKRKMADHSNGAQRNPVSQPIQHAEKSAQT